jgi:tetratricopeptide (TPR) repeat protein
MTHEARYWRRAAAAVGLPEDGALLKAVVAAAALLGAVNLADAATTVAHVPDLADAPLAQRRLWARWLYQLYPADTEGRLGSLQPDLLAETHVVQQLSGDTSLATGCLRELPISEAVRALTVLARAWVHQDGAQRLITDALNADLAHLALAAAEVALQTSSAMGRLLAAALRDAPAAEEVLIQVADAIPYPSIALDEANLAASWRVRRSLSRDTEPGTIAMWSNKAGLMLNQSGRPADALPLLEETVAIYRDLAAADPGRYRSDLATSLHNLGFGFAELANPANALPAEEEAVAIRSELAVTDPRRYRHELASSLNNLGNRLSELGRSAEALPVAEQAVAIRRELAAADPDRHRPDLAQSLNNLGSRLWELGRSVEALPVAEEAVAIYRELTDSNPHSYRSELARCLNNLAIAMFLSGHSADSLRFGQEAVAVRRELAAVNPGRHRPDLAQSLCNLGATLFMVERPLDALVATQEAVAIYRQLLTANPNRRFQLAQSLDNLAKVLATLGRSSEAAQMNSEADALRNTS